MAQHLFYICDFMVYCLVGFFVIYLVVMETRTILVHIECGSSVKELAPMPLPCAITHQTHLMGSLYSNVNKVQTRSVWILIWNLFAQAVIFLFLLALSFLLLILLSDFPEDTIISIQHFLHWRIFLRGKTALECKDLTFILYKNTFISHSKIESGAVSTQYWPKSQWIEILIWLAQHDH